MHSSLRFFPAQSGYQSWRYPFFLGKARPRRSLLAGIRITLLTAVILPISLLAQAQIVFDNYTDTGSPPTQLGSYPMNKVVDNTNSNGSLTNSIPLPNSSPIKLKVSGVSDPLTVVSSGVSFPWGHDYSGKAYGNLNNKVIFLDLPLNVKAFYLYAKPLLVKGDFTITAYSGRPGFVYENKVEFTKTVSYTEAQFFGFHVTNPERDILFIRIESSSPTPYIGEFGIAYGCGNSGNNLTASSNALTCRSSSVVLTAPAAGFKYVFTGPNNFNQSGESNTATVTQPGTYSLVETLSGGCLVTGTATITEDKAPPTNVTLSTDGPLTCAKTAVTLTGNCNNPYDDANRFEFFAPEGSFDVSIRQTARTQNDAKFIRAKPGTYTLIVTGSNGCAASPVTTFVGEDKAPPTNVTLSNDGPLTCAKTAITLTASGNGGYAYAFSGPNGFSQRVISQGVNATASVTTPGTYSVVVAGTNGCSASAQITSVTSNTSVVNSTNGPLIDLYNSTNGLDWVRKDNWLTGCTPCNWYGVTCDGNGRVTGVNLINNNLRGTLPASLSALSSLQSLELGANALTGGIPTGIASLTALQTLNLSRTQLGGTIPTSLGQLTQLRNLLLNESGLTGSLPASLGTLPQLQNLQLYANQLSGCFPGNYANLCGRAQISFANNPNLPGGGDFGTFCSSGTGSELVVSQYPQSGSACVGSAFSFSVVARGAGSYQWYKAGQRLAESGPVLSFSAVSAADAGTYQVYINYGCRPGAVQSDYVTLTVPQPGTGGCPQANTPPVVTANASQTATVGRAFSYTVNAFSDAQTPNSLTYTASVNPANGLSFDAATRVLSGTPSQPDPVSVTVTATDPGGLSASTSFSISVGPRMVGSTPLRVTLTASPQTLLTNGSTVLRATASGGTLGAPPNGYTYNFSGPGEFSASQPEEVTVTNLPAGVQTFTVVVTDATTPTNQSITKTVSVTVTAPATTALQVLHLDADNNGTNNAIKPTLQLQNTGTTPLDYGQITLRYWLTVEQFASLTNLAVYYAQLGTTKVKMKYVALDKPRQGALGYVEYSFDGSAGSLAAGANSGPIQTGIAKQDYTAFNEADDYSYANTRSLTANSRITAYLNGQLVWGTEPAEVAIQQIVKAYTENKSGSSTNSISTFLQVRNEGNGAVNYGDLKVRYYFTSEGSSPLNFYLDYAVVGNQKVKGQFGRLNPPLANADTYLELSFDGSLGTLNPGSSTGNLQYRLAKGDWSNFDQSNDYSYQNGTQPLAENSRVVVYLAGQRVYGSEPGAAARQAIPENDSPLRVKVLGNPAAGAEVRFEVEGAEGQSLQMQLTDVSGQSVSERSLERAQALERQTLPIANQKAGVLLLQVRTPNQSQTVKVLKTD